MFSIMRMVRRVLGCGYYKNNSKYSEEMRRATLVVERFEYMMSVGQQLMIEVDSKFNEGYMDDTPMFLRIK